MTEIINVSKTKLVLSASPKSSAAHLPYFRPEIQRFSHQNFYQVVVNGYLA